MSNEKKVPMRQCLGCREMHPKRELIRAVKSKDGKISLDFTGKLSGRGAYICRDAACFAKAKRAKAFERAFSCAIASEVYSEMEAALKEDENE